jgi:hypothetical protein
MGADDDPSFSLDPRVGPDPAVEASPGSDVQLGVATTSLEDGLGGDRPSQALGSREPAAHGLDRPPQLSHGIRPS